MASSSGVQPQQQQQQHQFQLPHQCKECGYRFNSAESLEVHISYHKDNLLNKWAMQASSSSSEETNNNNTKPPPATKREFIPNTIAAAADSSDAMLTKRSPEYGSRATPETSVNFGHPPTPQSYQSASSSYQNNTPSDNSAFSPNFQTYHAIKQEPTSPQFHPNYASYPENQFMVHVEPQPPSYSLEYIPKVPNTFRYHPYQQQHPQQTYNNSQVSSSSPAYPPQPTPSPSPKQCDKCGYVCETANQLVEHLNIAHHPSSAPALPTYQQQNNFLFGNQPEQQQQQQQPKTEEEQQSDILDLDSHKVVHQIYAEDEKRQNGDANSRPVVLGTPWLQQQQQQKMYNVQEQQRLYANGREIFSQEQKLYSAHQDYMSGGSVTTTTQPEAPVQNYRPFEHLPPQPATPVISSTQLPNPAPTNGPPSTKSANWKSNEARRPKTYNCTACNKWFTSSGHLKRHYNTTLHKNAVKSSGQPDPATMPISAHHHPARDSASNREDAHSGSPNEDSRGDDNSLPPTLYERQPPAVPLGLSNLSSASPPNGEAGLSATNLDSRGLLPLTSTPQHHGFPMGPSMEENHHHHHQFQMYPNVSAPHVTLPTATNSHSITGEYHHHQYVGAVNNTDTQPLPSFADIQVHRFGGGALSLGTANVGGGGPATAPYSYYNDNAEQQADDSGQSDDYHLLLNVVEPDTLNGAQSYSPPLQNNNNNNTSKIDLQAIHVDVIVEECDEKPSPPSPKRPKGAKKPSYEENSSPQISSTVPTAPRDPFKCFDCDKVFNRPCYLTQHNKTFHSGEKPYKCQRCGKRFSNDTLYMEHTAKHAGDKPFKCTLCPKQFNHKTDLRRHECLHTGVKPYVCDKCHKGFIRKDHMVKHYDTHTKKPHAGKGAR